MKREFRLTRSIDFKRVRRSGRFYAHPLVALVAAKNVSTELHIGISAGRSVGNAVKRNQAKRRIRACLQNLYLQIPPGWDLVILARKPIAQANYLEIYQALEGLLSRAGLLQRAE